MSELNKVTKVFIAIRRQKVEIRTKSEGKKCKSTQKHIGRSLSSIFWVVSATKNICLCTEAVWGKGKCFEQSIDGDRVGKNLEMFWMNNRRITVKFVSKSIGLAL